MTYELAVEWIAFVAGLPFQPLLDKFRHDEVSEDLVTGLGHAFANNKRLKFLYPPNNRNYKPKPYTFICQCGCGETWTRDYVTGHKPKYANNAHRERVYRRNRKARAAK